MAQIERQTCSLVLQGFETQWQTGICVQIMRSFWQIHTDRPPRHCRLKAARESFDKPVICRIIRLRGCFGRGSRLLVIDFVLVVAFSTPLCPVPCSPFASFSSPFSCTFLAPSSRRSVLHPPSSSQSDLGLVPGVVESEFASELSSGLASFPLFSSSWPLSLSFWLTVSSFLRPVGR